MESKDYVLVDKPCLPSVRFQRKMYRGKIGGTKGRKMKIISWLLVAMLAFVSISIHNSMKAEINHLQEQLSVCRDWNNIFLKVITE